MPKTFTYKNPIYSDAIGSIRDAQINVVGGRYYLIGSCPPYWEGQSPGIKLHSSPDLLNWTYEGLLLDSSKLDEKCWYHDRFWAPEIHPRKGRFYLTFSAQNEKHGPKHWGQGLAVASDICGPYTVVTEEKPLRYGGIDLSIFTDDDGRSYGYSTGKGGIMAAELDLDAYRYIGEPVPCTQMVKGTWEDRVMEGPFVIKRQGVYYLFYSCGARGYEVGYATAKAPLGPWTKQPGPLFGVQNEEACAKLNIAFSGDPNHPLLFAGHNAIFTGPDGRDWICALYQEKGKPEQLGIDPIWIENGLLKTNAPTFTEQTVVLP